MRTGARVAITCPRPGSQRQNVPTFPHVVNDLCDIPPAAAVVHTGALTTRNRIAQHGGIFAVRELASEVHDVENGGAKQANATRSSDGNVRLKIVPRTAADAHGGGFDASVALAAYRAGVRRLSQSIWSPAPFYSGDVPSYAVSSLDDPRLQPFRALKKSNFTRWSGRFIAEGEKLVRRLLASPFPVESVLSSRRFVDEIAPLVPPEVPLLVVDDALVPELVGFNFHRGLLACGRRLPATFRWRILPAGCRARRPW